LLNYGLQFSPYEKEQNLQQLIHYTLEEADSSIVQCDALGNNQHKKDE